MDKEVFWSEDIAGQILNKRKSFVVNTGITPSGEIHVGNLREILTADTVYRSLKEHVRDVKFSYVVDSYDPLRHVYPFLDERVYENFVGQPLSDIPCPCGKHESYSDHFLEPFLEALVILGIKIDLRKNDRLYKEGFFNKSVITALENTEKIKNILHDTTGKEMDPSWSPFNPICEKCKRITGTTVKGFSKKDETIDYSCECGFEGSRKIQGGGKLTWRVDWPARWEALKVSVEPFGKDHASRGGSYDTGKKICEEIFGYEAPFPIVYEWISLKGMGDMSSSKGNVISTRKMLEVLPPEVLRYAIIKTKPSKAIAFDPGLPIISLMDEYDDKENKNRNEMAYRISLTPNYVPIGIPFRHIVSLVQIAMDDVGRMMEILKSNGYKNVDEKALSSRAKYARQWIDTFAPEEVKFSLAQSLPKEAKGLSETQKKALAELSGIITEDMNGEEIQEAIYKIKDKVGLSPAEFFNAVYIVLLGKDKGPRAGMFLSMLDKKFLKERFEEASLS